MDSDFSASRVPPDRSAPAPGQPHPSGVIGRVAALARRTFSRHPEAQGDLRGRVYAASSRVSERIMAAAQTALMSETYEPQSIIDYIDLKSWKSREFRAQLIKEIEELPDRSKLDLRVLERVYKLMYNVNNKHHLPSIIVRVASISSLKDPDEMILMRLESPIPVLVIPNGPQRYHSFLKLFPSEQQNSLQFMPEHYPALFGENFSKIYQALEKLPEKDRFEAMEKALLLDSTGEHFEEALGQLEDLKDINWLLIPSGGLWEKQLEIAKWLKGKTLSRWAEMDLDIWVKIVGPDNMLACLKLCHRHPTLGAPDPKKIDLNWFITRFKIEEWSIEEQVELALGPYTLREDDIEFLVVLANEHPENRVLVLQLMRLFTENYTAMSFPQEESVYSYADWLRSSLKKLLKANNPSLVAHVLNSVPKDKDFNGEDLLESGLQDPFKFFYGVECSEEEQIRIITEAANLRLSVPLFFLHEKLPKELQEGLIRNGFHSKSYVVKDSYELLEYLSANEDLQKEACEHLINLPH